jgi:hypothetical protein
MAELPAELQARTVELIDMRNLDAYIEKHLGRAWSLQQNDYLGNETLTSYEVWPDPEATAVVEAWLASPPVGGVGRVDQPGYGESVKIYTCEILNELCNRGLLPEGDLTVHVWW